MPLILSVIVLNVNMLSVTAPLNCLTCKATEEIPQKMNLRHSAEKTLSKTLNTTSHSIIRRHTECRIFYCYAECLSAGCYYAERRGSVNTDLAKKMTLPPRGPVSYGHV